jgi:mRNA interferase RelE/StbE
MNYRLVVPKVVQKQLDALPHTIQRRVSEHVLALAANPRPPGSIKLKGYKDQYRIRIGDFRVRYRIDDDELLVLLISCKNRKDVYKD